MAEKEEPVCSAATPGGGVGKAGHQVSNCSADVFLLHQHYIGKEIADIVTVINQIYRRPNDEIKWSYEYILDLFPKVNSG